MELNDDFFGKVKNKTNVETNVETSVEIENKTI